MNQAVQLDDVPAETATTDPSDGKAVTDEPAPKEESAAPAVDDELSEEQLMWLGRS